MNKIIGTLKVSLIKMEKNKQIIEFSDLFSKIDIGPTIHYPILRSIFLDFIEYIGTNWDTYVKTRTKKEIIENIKYFNQYIYLPF